MNPLQLAHYQVSGGIGLVVGIYTIHPHIALIDSYSYKGSSCPVIGAEVW